MTLPPELARALAAWIEALVDRRVEAKLAELGVVAAAGRYDSDHLPPRTSRRTFHAWLRSGRVAGASRDARGWACTAEAWRAARAQGVERPRRGVAAKATGGNVVSIDTLLAKSGLRATARGSR